MKAKFVPRIAGGVAMLWSFIVPTWSVLGIVLALGAGIYLGRRIHPGRPWVPPPGQRGPLVRGLVGAGGRLLVLLVLVAPIASGGLFLPSRHNPNTFMKYLSVVVVIPGNLFEVPILSFPGLPVAVSLALVAMVVGLYLPEWILPRRVAVFPQLAGMLLLVVTPVLTRLLSARPGFQFVFGYNFLFYLGFLGILVQFVAGGSSSSHGLPQASGARPHFSGLLGAGLLLAWSATGAGGSSYCAAHAMPLAAAMGLFDFLDFEAAHHGVAGALSGFLTGTFAIDVVRNLFPPWWWESTPAAMEVSAPEGGAQPPSPGEAPPPPSGPAHGDVVTVRDHRGLEMDLTYDANAGQWVTPDNTWFDPSRAEEARMAYEAQRAWSAAEHERMAAGDSAQDRSLRQLTEMQRLAREYYETRINNRRKQAILGEMQKIWSAEAEMWNQEAAREDRWLTVAEWTETLADIGIDVLEKVTGPAGQKIKHGYVAAKNVAGGISEAHSEGIDLWKGAAKGAGNAAIELGFDAAKGKLGKATQGKIPGLPAGSGPSLQKIGEFVPGSNADKIFKERLIQSTITHAAGSAAQSQAEQKYLLKPVQKKLGLKR